MVSKKSKTVTLERRGDQTSLFWMIGRYGPAAALALIAMLSVWAAFILFRTTRRRRRKATADKAEVVLEKEAFNATAHSPEDRETNTVVSTEKSDLGIPVQSQEDGQRGKLDAEGPVKRRSRRSGYANEESDAPRHDDPEPHLHLPVKPGNPEHVQKDPLDAVREGAQRCSDTDALRATPSGDAETSPVESESCCQREEPRQGDDQPLGDGELNADVTEISTGELDSLGKRAQEEGVATHDQVSCEAAAKEVHRPRDEKDPPPSYVQCLSSLPQGSEKQSDEDDNGEEGDDAADQSTLVCDEGRAARGSEEDGGEIGPSVLAGAAVPSPQSPLSSLRAQPEPLQCDPDGGLPGQGVDHLDVAELRDRVGSGRVVGSVAAPCAVASPPPPSVKRDLTCKKVSWSVECTINGGSEESSDEGLDRPMEASVASLTDSKDVRAEGNGKKVETRGGGMAETQAEEKDEDDYERTEINIMEATMDNNEWMTGCNAEASYPNVPWITSGFPSLAEPLNETDSGSTEFPLCFSPAGTTSSPEEAQETRRPSPEDVGHHPKMVASVLPMSQNVSVIFCVHYVTGSPSQMVAVAGDGPELGSWKSYTPLQRAKDGYWTGSVCFPAESQVAWKFVLVEEGQILRWEECGNRHLETGHGEEVHVNKGWGLM